MVIVVVGVCAAAFLMAGAASEKRGKVYRVEFDNAFARQGRGLPVGGVNAGMTSDFDVVKRKGEAPKAVVEVEITEPGFADFREDASCEIRPQSLIGEYYVDCQPGRSGRAARRRHVPVEQTSSTIPTDVVNNIMRRPTGERPADPDRARHRARRPARRPAGGARGARTRACARPRGRCASSATRTRSSRTSSPTRTP